MAPFDGKVIQAADTGHAIADAGHPDVAVVIVQNPDDYASIVRTAEGTVESGTKVIQASK